jgi:hypothetical protein
MPDIRVSKNICAKGIRWISLKDPPIARRTARSFILPIVNIELNRVATKIAVISAVILRNDKNSYKTVRIEGLKPVYEETCPARDRDKRLNNIPQAVMSD